MCWDLAIFSMAFLKPINLTSKLFRIGVLFLVSCQTPHQNATDGKVKIACLPSIQDLMNSQEMVFESIYPKASIDLHFSSEEEAIRLFNQDSVSMIVLPRQPALSEFQKADDIRIHPFFKSAVAFISNNSLSDSLCSSYLRKITKQAEDSSGFLSIIVKSSNLEILNYLSHKISVDMERWENVYQFNDETNFYDYLRTSRRRLGVIDYAEISNLNKDETQLQKLLDLKIVALKQDDSSKAIKPSQSSIATENYPLTRTYYIVFRSTRMNVARGFATFLLKDRGQRIVLKAGLVPITSPHRKVRIENEW